MIMVCIDGGYDKTNPALVMIFDVSTYMGYIKVHLYQNVALNRREEEESVFGRNQHIQN